MANISQIKLPSGETYGVRAPVIPYGEVDSTSTSTAYTATVPGISELVDGTIVMLKNGVVTSASGFTININELGAKPVYNSMATGHDTTAPTRDTTIFNISYTMLFIYSTDLVSGGCWICYRGYDGNTNTIGYQLRTNSANMPAVQEGYRYRLWLTDADGQGWVPINTSTSTNATSARALNSRPIDPFGRIVYCSHNATKNAGEGLGTTYQWEQYTLTIGYSYVKTLVDDAPVYLKCTPQADGSAVMADIVSALPTTNDGYIYIFLGTAYSTTAMELLPVHPVYWHDGTGIRLWTGSASSGATAMTDAEIEAAVDEAFAVSYSITKGNSSINGITLERSITAAEITEAKAGTTVYVLCNVSGVKTAPSVTVTSDGTLEGAKVFKFTMPESNITVSGYMPK